MTNLGPIQTKVNTQDLLAWRSRFGNCDRGLCERIHTACSTYVDMTGHKNQLS